MRFRALFGAAALSLAVLGAAPAGAGAFAGTNGTIAPPYTQCPAVGADTSCAFLVELTGSHASPTVTVYNDQTQQYYDGNDDELVAVQNDTDGPVASIALGIAGSRDNIFGFDGDGICTRSPQPSGCPFSTASNMQGGDYAGPDMSYTVSSTDNGTVNFTDMGGLPKGAYTYFGLEAPPDEPGVPAGGGNNYPSTCLHRPPAPSTPPTYDNCTNPATYGAPPTDKDSARIAASAPADYYDQALLHGPNVGYASGAISYKVYSDPACLQQVADATPSPNAVTSDGFSASIPPSKAVGAALPNDATYYWKAIFTSSDTTSAHANSDSAGQCGQETMTFGTPPGKPATGVTTTLSDGVTPAGPHITVAAGQPVTDQAVITGPTANTAVGTVTYLVYSDNTCSAQVKNLFPPKGDVGQVQNGTGAPSAKFNTAAKPLTVGTYYLVARYSGDSSHATSVAPCGGEVLDVRQPSSVAAAFSAPGFATGPNLTVPDGTTVTDTASVLTGGVAAPATATAASGSMSYAVYKTAGCTGLPIAKATTSVLYGKAGPFQAPAFPSLPQGVYKVIVSYSGDSTYAPSSLTCGSHVLKVTVPALLVGKPTLSGGSIVVTVSVSARGSFTVTGTVLNVGALSRKRKGAGGAFGKARLVAPKAGAYRIRLSPNAKSRRALAKGRKLKVSETIAFKPKDGSGSVKKVIRVTVRGKKK